MLALCGELAKQTIPVDAVNFAVVVYICIVCKQRNRYYLGLTVYHFITLSHELFSMRYSLKLYNNFAKNYVANHVK